MTNGKPVFLSATVLGEARELSGLDEKASWNKVFARLNEIIYDYKIKEQQSNNFFDDIKNMLEI